MSDSLDALWLATLQDVVSRAAHEVRDALNGVSLNLEVLRSRLDRPTVDTRTLASFATAASDQFELLSARAEALVFLVRPHRAAAGPADVALTLRHLATLLVPAAKADGGRLEVNGADRSAQSGAPATAIRLALAAGLLSLTKDGGASHCRLDSGSETVVRFSHESAGACSLEPAVASALTAHQIRLTTVGAELHIVFPGS